MTAEQRSASEDLDRLAASEERFRWITGFISDAIVIVGENHELLHYNPAAARLFGHETLARQMGSDAVSPLAQQLLDAAEAERELETDGATTSRVLPHSLDTIWDKRPATAVLLEATGARPEHIGGDDGAATTAMVIEVSDIDQPRRVLPIVNDLFEVLTPEEGVTQAGGAAWCVVWRGRTSDESWVRANQIIDGLNQRIGGKGEILAGIARQRRDEDTPSLLRRCHRALNHARSESTALATDPGEERVEVSGSLLYEQVIGEHIASDLSPVVDVSNHHAVGAIAQPTINGTIAVQVRDLLRSADIESGQSFDRLTAADALVRFNRWRRPSLTDSLHLPVYRHSIAAPESYLRWLQRATSDIGLRPDIVVLALHEADVVADPATIRFLALARMAGFRTAIRGLSGARLPLATLVDLWPDALLLAPSVVRGDESRLLPALLAAGDEIGAVAIATGVSSTAQLDLLLDYECRYAVGPLLMRSIPADEAI